VFVALDLSTLDQVSSDEAMFSVFSFKGIDQPSRNEASRSDLDWHGACSWLRRSYTARSDSRSKFPDDRRQRCELKIPRWVEGNVRERVEGSVSATADRTGEAVQYREWTGHTD